tara:strand:- start:65 stop:904 length:840 start_codon:yes stop_codon:yes gene_type:complete
MSFIIRKSKSNNLRSWSLKDGTINPLFHKIKSQFPIPARQYFAGIWDGDGYQRNRARSNRPTKTLELSLEMAENGKEPVLMLAKIFDLTIRYCTRKGEKYKNYQPTYKVSLSGPKGEMFMLLIYPYLIENKSFIRKFLLERKCPENFLKADLQFSWPYLAGYADAEGHYVMKLRHDKQKRKNGYAISSSYKFKFNLSSNDFESLRFIKQQIINKGFHFRKDDVAIYNNIKWNPTLRVNLKGGPVEHSKLYKNFYMYSLISKKKKIMEKTMEYARIIHRQ